MREKIKYFLVSAWDEITYGIRCFCGRPSPMKRFIVILIIGIALSVGYFYSIVSSIYNIGKRDAQKELMEIEHIKPLELPYKSNDSINLLKQKKYEQQQSNECE